MFLSTAYFSRSLFIHIHTRVCSSSWAKVYTVKRTKPIELCPYHLPRSLIPRWRRSIVCLARIFGTRSRIYDLPPCFVVVIENYTADRMEPAAPYPYHIPRSSIPRQHAVCLARIIGTSLASTTLPQSFRRPRHWDLSLEHQALCRCFRRNVPSIQRELPSSSKARSKS